MIRSMSAPWRPKIRPTRLAFDLVGPSNWPMVKWSQRLTNFVKWLHLWSWNSNVTWMMCRWAGCVLFRMELLVGGGTSG
ncbi:unnamed protein product [Cladocopium goreaui]|uniref:Uncharacterized protein n=1 Tax=Cladocopium goreaui TaxID=2562237 RepID=A0A9P1GDZ6_9DINO|nr:unnamed protein product [Cladocopium goreaui]